MKIIARRDALLPVLAVHVAIDAFLISNVSLYPQTSTLPGFAIFCALLVFPAAQGCLIALWLATARMRFSLRLPLALLATVAPLIVLLRIQAMRVSHPLAPALAFAAITQLLTILILINGQRLARRQFRLWWSGQTKTDARPIQFSLRQLLLWTAILAIILGTGKTVCGWLGWTADILGEEDFYTFQIPAVYNALYALLALSLFTVRVRWPVRMLLFPLFVAAGGVLACSMPLAVECVLGTQSRPSLHTSLRLAVPQIIYHTITLWPLWLCGCIGRPDDTASGPRETTPASGNPFAQ